MKSLRKVGKIDIIEKEASGKNEKFTPTGKIPSNQLFR